MRHKISSNFSNTQSILVFTSLWLATRFRCWWTQADRANPFFSNELRDRAASIADLAADDLAMAQVVEYRPGFEMGWHWVRDVFGDIIGVSLRSLCSLRFRRTAVYTWERYSLTVEPRSIYLLRGLSRTEWQHGFPSVDALRYSIMVRSLR